MPNIDLTDVLLDADFVVALSCARAAQTVSEGGIASNSVTALPFYGIVTSDQGAVLQRLAEAERVTGSILIHSKFQMTTGASGVPADVITWNGGQYTVADVNNYSQYGAGFVCAKCVPVSISG